MTKPLLQLVPRDSRLVNRDNPNPDSRTPNPDWSAVERNSASVAELAPLLGITERALLLRIERGCYVTYKVPSRRAAGQTETRISIRSLPLGIQKRLQRQRRRAARDAARQRHRHPGGYIADRDSDRRVALTTDELLAVQGLFARREQPSIAHVFDQLVADCLRCHASPMQPVDPRACGRYKLHRCPQCGWTLSYATVRRAIEQTPPEVETLGRASLNTWVNRHGRYARLRRDVFHRNDRVYGDHHVCDLEVWDWRQPFNKDGSPRLFRPWLSAWQDKATDVVAWRLGLAPNTELLALAYRAYVLRWGIPRETWTDWGRDYRSKKFCTLVESIGSEPHRALPTRRGGVSHAKSKMIERWFGSFERGLMQELPGWTGSNAVVARERDDLRWQALERHKQLLRDHFHEYASGLIPEQEAPFLLLEQAALHISNWVEGVYLQRVKAPQDCSPAEAWRRDPAPVRTLGSRNLSERVLDVLLMEARTRKIGRNGVEVDGRTYWHESFFGLRGAQCSVRWDPQQLGECVVSVRQQGAPDLVVIAQAQPFQDWTAEDYKKMREMEKREREIARENLAIRQRAAQGVSAWSRIVAEKAAQAQPLAAAAGDGPALPVLTPAHHIAQAVGAATQSSARPRRGHSEHSEESALRPALKLLPDDLEDATPRTRIADRDVAAAFIAEVDEEEKE